jgi:hypothetical protein
METIFSILSFAPGPFWALILFFPQHRKAMLAVDLFLFALALHFAWLTLPIVPELFPLIAKPTLDGMRAFLSTREGTLGVWNHMILGDLWIGRWVAQATVEDRYPLITRLIFIPPIVFFGPLGLCFYLIFRMVWKREFSLTRAGA